MSRPLRLKVGLHRTAVITMPRSNPGTPTVHVGLTVWCPRESRLVRAPGLCSDACWCPAPIVRRYPL